MARSTGRKARDRRWHLLRSAKRVGMTREIFRLGHPRGREMLRHLWGQGQARE